jgi:hypothetical protein
MVDRLQRDVSFISIDNQLKVILGDMSHPIMVLSFTGNQYKTR